MDIKQRQLIKKYVDIVLNKWWLIAASLLVTVTLGLVYYLSLPKQYESKAILSYEQQQINPARMDPEQGRNRLRESLATLKELVISRNSLEKVMTQFSLYEEARKRLPIEDVIESMRKNIKITPSDQGDIFSVSFQGSDPQKVMKVTNALASLFIEENLKYREERATEISNYTESELANAKKVLDEKEKVMRDYKLQNYNEMPEQRAGNLASLQALMAQNQGIQVSIQDLERTKALVQEQVVLQQRLAAAQNMNNALPGSGNALARQPETDAERLQRLRYHLNILQAKKYTEKHPEMRRTKQLIAQLERQVGNQQLPRQSSLPVNMEVQRLQLQLNDIEANIKQLRASQENIPAAIAKYQRWIEAAPVREAEWNGLTRDYAELRRHYDELVAHNLAAQSAEFIERNQKGSKYKIVDPAHLPAKPSKPNFVKIFLAALAAGLAMSVGTILALDFMDTSFKDAVEIEEDIGVPVVCSISYIEMDTEIRKERFWFLLSATLLSLYGVALLVTIVYLWTRGKIII